MGELTAGLNWLAVAVGTFLSFGLGAIWFSPAMFGVKWRLGLNKAMGEDIKPSAAALGLQLLGTFLLAWIIAIAVASGSLLLAGLSAITVSVVLAASDLLGGSDGYAAMAEGSFPLAMAAIMLLCHAIV